MNYDYIKVCPLCRKDDNNDEASALLLGATKPMCSNNPRAYFEVQQHIYCCKECGERLKKAIGNEITNIMLDSSEILKKYSTENMI